MSLEFGDDLRLRRVQKGDSAFHVADDHDVARGMGGEHRDLDGKAAEFFG